MDAFDNIYYLDYSASSGSREIGVPRDPCKNKLSVIRQTSKKNCEGGEYPDMEKALERVTS